MAVSPCAALAPWDLRNPNGMVAEAVKDAVRQRVITGTETWLAGVKF